MTSLMHNQTLVSQSNLLLQARCCGQSPLSESRCLKHITCQNSISVIGKTYLSLLILPDFNVAKISHRLRRWLVRRHVIGHANEKLVLALFPFNRTHATATSSKIGQSHLDFWMKSTPIRTRTRPRNHYDFKNLRNQTSHQSAKKSRNSKYNTFNRDHEGFRYLTYGSGTEHSMGCSLRSVVAPNRLLIAPS